MNFYYHLGPCFCCESKDLAEGPLSLLLQTVVAVYNTNITSPSIL